MQSQSLVCLGLALSSLFLTTACGRAPGSTAEDRPEDAMRDPFNLGEDPCGAEAFEPYVQQSIDAVPQALKDRDELRILPPGSIITTDVIPWRLNVDLDEEGIIEDLWCG